MKKRVREAAISLFKFLARIYRRYKYRRYVNKLCKGMLVDINSLKQHADEINAYWIKHYGKKVGHCWHYYIASITGAQDVRYIPHDVWVLEILPYFNDFTLSNGFSDKNLYHMYCSYPRKPQSVISRKHGNYYDPDHNIITRGEALRFLYFTGQDMIIKESRTDDGKGVRKLQSDGSVMLLNEEELNLERIEAIYGLNYVVQQKVKQSRLMSAVHSESLNTIRLLTFRWQNKIHKLIAFARFGTEHRVTDNLGTGGLLCGIDHNGLLFEYAIDKWGQIIDKHPTSGHDFRKNFSIPGFSRLCTDAMELHRELYHFDLVSWDFGISEDDLPILIEHNFCGASYAYQYAAKRPIFGDMTEEVLLCICKNRLGRK